MPSHLRDKARANERILRLHAHIPRSDLTFLPVLAFVSTMPLSEPTAVHISKTIVLHGSRLHKRCLLHALLIARALKEEDEEFDALGDPVKCHAAWDEWIASL